MKISCEKCNTEIDMFGNDHITDAWVKSGFQFYDVKCECGNTQTRKFNENVDFNIDTEV